ncbi:MAG: DNA polymerase III subunit [Eubacteriales bacterium]|nr:DNA polymerase III subunit [Eubacteriales bacterium]
MISFDDVPGNTALKAELQRALAARFPQTVLLSGDDSAGLRTLATVLAAGILCEAGGARPCGRCLSCRKVAQGIHPDLTVIDEDEAELKVDLARRLKADDAIVPNDGARRVTVLCHAQNLNPMAQNALLKELEEPPSYAFFVLTAERPDALLQTVRSRCTRFALAPPQQTAEDEQAAALLSPYLAAIAARREDRMMLAALAMEKTPRRALLGVFGVLQAALRDAVFAAKALPQAPLQPALREQTQALARAVSAERLLAAYALTGTLIDRVGRNAAAAAVTCALTSDMYRICFL